MKGAKGTLAKILLKEGVAELLKELLLDVGKFYRTPEGQLFFFRDADHRLYAIEDRTFERYLILLTNNVTGLRGQWLPRLQAWARFEASEVNTHFLAYNDGPDLSVIALNMFDGFMMRRRRGKEWERVPNGTDGILFLTPSEFLTPWSANLGRNGGGENLDWLCSLGHLAGDGPLSVDDQRRLLRAWVLHLFLPALNPVHPIPLLEGVTGSGKSVLGEIIGRWLMGPEFEVIDLPSGDAARAEESIKIALCKRPIVVIDNVDSPSTWLEDFMCRYATGVRMSRRKLYTNTEETHFTPRAGLIVTSRDPHFHREDVARRLLPIRFAPIPEAMRRSETEIRAELDARRSDIWADVLNALAHVQDAWPTLRATLRPSHSLADFSVFGATLAAVKNGDVDPTDWNHLMLRLERAQAQFATAEDPLAELLAEEIPHNGMLRDQPVSELYQTLEIAARARGIPWTFRSVGALTKALKNKRQALEGTLGVRIALTNHHQGGQFRVAIVRLPADAEATPGGHGAQGGDDSPTPLSAVEKIPLDA